jgi:sulfate/thiosulfate transport system permease protein
MLNRKFNALPGFSLTMGITLLYLSVIVLIPMAALFLKTSELSFAWPSSAEDAVPNFWTAISGDRAMAAYRLTFGASLIAAFINAVFGTILAWVLVRYTFPGRKFIDALVDFPFALPTAVAGLTLANLFADNGWLGKYLVPLGIKGAFTPLGVVIALTFVGMPFAVRTLQPVLESLDRSLEEAAATLGSGRWRTFTRVIAPTLAPTVITGFALSFARAVGEYGSIVFISGNIQYETQIAPMLIFERLEGYDYLGATAIAAVLMIISFAILIGINYLEAWASRFTK